MSVVECVIHLQWQILPAEEMLGCMNSMADQNDASTHLACTNVVSHVPLIYLEGVVYDCYLTENGLRRMLRPKQKSIAFTRTLSEGSPNLIIRSWTYSQDAFYSERVLIYIQLRAICWMREVPYGGFMVTSMPGLVKLFLVRN